MTQNEDSEGQGLQGARPWQSNHSTTGLDDILYSIENRPSSSSLYLSGRTARAMAESNSGEKKESMEFGESRSDVDKKAKEVISNIPRRIKRLLYDIAILSRSGYLDTIDIWTYMKNLENITFTDIYHGSNKNKEDDAEVNIGYDIGLAFSTLTGDVHNDKRGKNFLFGFMKAYFTEHSIDQSPSQNKFDNNPSIEVELMQLLKDIFEKYEIKASKLLIFHAHTYMVKNTEQDLEGTSVIEEGLREFIEKELGQTFGKYVHLQTQIEREWNSINNEDSVDEGYIDNENCTNNVGVPGLDAENILHALWDLKTEDAEKSTRANSENIATKAGKPSRFKTQVTYLLNKLSNDGKNQPNKAKNAISNSNNKEIVYYEHGEWFFTVYGWILMFYSPRRNLRFLRIQDYGLLSDLGLTVRDIDVPLRDADHPVQMSNKESRMVEEAVEYYFD